MPQRRSPERVHRSSFKESRVSKRPRTPATRKSIRLQEAARRTIRLELDDKQSRPRHPLSPSSSDSQIRSGALKRKQPDLDECCLGKETPKRPRTSSTSAANQKEQPLDPVACWVQTGSWAEAFKGGLQMAHGSSNKRESPSRHNTDRLERLSENGITMRESDYMQNESKDLCLSYLQGDDTPSEFPCYPSEKIPKILERIQPLNEARLQRDIIPWTVPSVENLYFSGTIEEEYFGEEIQAEWTRCATMGDTKPKPDYVAGLLRKAFLQEELRKLQNFSTPNRPWLFTPNLCFPFLICEAKTGWEGLEKANRQNLHSASIAVRAVIELYKAAFGKESPDRVEKLYGQILVFSVLLNNQQADLYGHFAVPSDDTPGGLKFHRHGIASFNFVMSNGPGKYKAYNFVLNIYKQFAPEHLRRIKDAVAELPKPDKRTRPSFAASDLGLNATESQQNSEHARSQDDAVFRTPSEPASVVYQRESKAQIEQLLHLVEQGKQESKEREQKMEQQLEQQMQEGKEREQKMEQESKEREQKMEQESKEREQKMERQLEQQRQESKQQMEQQRQQYQEIISLLKQSLGK